MRVNAMNNDKLIEVKNLKKHFPISKGMFRKSHESVKAVDGISFHIDRGETFGLVGESGCGKSTTGRCILQLEEVTSGEIYYEDKNIVELSSNQMRCMRRNIQLIFQDAFASLDPRMSTADIIGEPLLVQGIVNKKGSEYHDRIHELFKMVELDPDYAWHRYPHEFSGGQRQRIGIARALAAKPALIVCDEPVSALDVSIQAQIINLMINLREQLNLTYLFIAHDLSLVRNISNRVAVMYLGKIVEITKSADLYSNPLHPYTISLLSAVPIPDPQVDRTRQRIVLEGEVPSPKNPPAGCTFHTRCFKCKDICKEKVPEMREVGDNHFVACHMV